jgi:hypothetical protein
MMGITRRRQLKGLRGLRLLFEPNLSETARVSFHVPEPRSIPPTSAARSGGGH